MSHWKMIAVGLLLAAPFGAAFYQDRTRPDATYTDRDQAMAPDVTLGEAEPAADEAEPADEADPAEREPADEPTPLTEAQLRLLFGKKIASPGAALRGLRIGMRRAEVGDLSEELLAWLDDSEGPVPAQIALIYAEDDTIRGIHLRFPDDGGARTLLGALWGPPAELSGTRFLWTDGDRRAGTRVMLDRDDADEVATVTFSRYAAIESILGAPGGRLGFETTPILGASAESLVKAYAGVGSYDADLWVFHLPQPGLRESPSAYTSVVVDFDDEQRASTIEIHFDASDDLALHDAVRAALETRFGDPVSDEQGRLRYGKPPRATFDEGILSIQR